MAGYNFMTVVTHSWGRAKTTPLPAHVCSFDSETWKGVQTPWDVPMEWPTSPMSPGLQPIVWNASWGAHYDDTRDFSYWITKPGFVFSPTRELTWDDFESEPFCMELYDDKNPDGQSRHHRRQDEHQVHHPVQRPGQDRPPCHLRRMGEDGIHPATLPRLHRRDLRSCAGAPGTGEAGKIRPGRKKPVDALGREPAPAAADRIPPVRRFAPKPA